MPTKSENIFELGAGTLYMTPLEGGGPVSIGGVKSLEVVMESTEEYADDMGYAPKIIPNSAEVTIELEPLSLPALWRLTYEPRLIVSWAWKKRPKLVRLVRHARRQRAREKNARRIIREFYEEVLRHGKE